jgi:hypothetical protein
MYLDESEFVGSISNNTIADVSAYYAGAAEADGIFISLGNSIFSGSISGNTVSGILAEDADYTWATGITGIVYDKIFGGTISDNTLTGISSADGDAAGIYLDASSSTTTVSITGNRMETAAGEDAYGLYAEAFTNGLGTPSVPMIFVGNGGTVNAPAAYMAYLNTDNPSASSVAIGPGHGGMGNNDFTTVTGVWSGNYLHDGGPIWAEGYPTFNYIHP